jgi:hypothetical protein
MRVENRSEFGQFRQDTPHRFERRKQRLASLAECTRFARARPSGNSACGSYITIPCWRSSSSFVLARHSAGSQIRSAAPRTARPPRFARWRACVSSLSLGWLHFAAPLAWCGQDDEAATGGLSFPAAWLWPSQSSRTARPRLSARLPSAGSPAPPWHGQHADFAVRTSHTFCTSTPQELHIKATTIPDGQSVTGGVVTALSRCNYGV